MKKILLIDDDPNVVDALIRGLREFHGFDVLLVEQPELALDKLQADSYDAIILDIMMSIPDDWSKEDRMKANNGFATGEVLYHKIRACSGEIPILILSARPRFHYTDENCEYIRKPASIADIADQLKTLIGNEK